MNIENLIFRCYARPDRDHPNRWVAHCIDLDLWASGKTLLDARMSLNDAISGYVDAVQDTDDVDSIAPLLRRKSPLRHRLLWHFARLRRERYDHHQAAYEQSLRFHIDGTQAVA